MRKTKIKLVTLGNLKYPVDFRSIEKWKSQVLEVHHIDQIQTLPDTDGDSWSYTDELLESIIQPDTEYDCTVGIINAPLEDNYYIRRLANSICILSLDETADILRDVNLSLENFIIRNLYELCSAYLEHGRQIPESVYAIAHDETRSCLFDMNANKADIVFSTAQPIICESCKVRMMRSQISKEFLPSVEKELKRIRKPLYYRLTDLIKTHPIWALVITSLSAIILNIFSNYVYDFLPKFRG